MSQKPTTENIYYCSGCKKFHARKNTQKWFKSYCTKIGSTVRMHIVKEATSMKFIVEMVNRVNHSQDIIDTSVKMIADQKGQIQSLMFDMRDKQNQIDSKNEELRVAKVQLEASEDRDKTKRERIKDVHQLASMLMKQHGNVRPATQVLIIGQIVRETDIV